jgi:hypothetical protein
MKKRSFERDHFPTEALKNHGKCFKFFDGKKLKLRV